MEEDHKYHFGDYAFTTMNEMILYNHDMLDMISSLSMLSILFQLFFLNENTSLGVEKTIHIKLVSNRIFFSPQSCSLKHSIVIKHSN